MKKCIVSLFCFFVLSCGQTVQAQESIQYIRPSASYSLRSVVTTPAPAATGESAVPTAVIRESATVAPPVVVTTPAPVALPTPALRTTATVVTPSNETKTDTLPTVKSGTMDIQCTKTISGSCILFSCVDGTKVNTCDLACKEEKTVEPAIEGSVATDEPKITGFFPTTGNAGTEVRVYLTKGKKNFSGPDSVEVGGVPIKMTSFSNVPGSKADFVIVFSLPVGAKTGKIVIKKPGTFATPAVSDQDFVVIEEQDAPSIVDIKPMAGYAGQEVTLELLMGNKKFSGIDSIEVGGVPAPIITQTNSLSFKPNGKKITFIVPEGAQSGKVTLTKKSLFGSVSSKQDFLIVPAQDAPTILSISPASGSVGDTVVVKMVPGKKNFSGLDGVFIGSVKAEVISQSADTSGVRTITIKVPADAKTGKIVLKKPALFSDVTSADDFVVKGAVKTLFQKITSFFKKK